MMIKVYWARSTTHLSMINAGMILFLTLSKLKESGYIEWGIEKYLVLLFILGAVVLALVGYIETRILKANQEEKGIQFTLTPQFVKIEKMVTEMYNDYRRKVK